MTHRRLCITKRRCLGLVPAYAVPGDIICVFGGSHVPFVLRPAGETFQLVGECYVHGIMQGEMPTTNVKVRDIKLV